MRPFRLCLCYLTCSSCLARVCHGRLPASLGCSQRRAHGFYTFPRRVHVFARCVLRFPRPIHWGKRQAHTRNRTQNAAPIERRKQAVSREVFACGRESLLRLGRLRPIAQSIEHRSSEPRVGGSSPSGRTCNSLQCKGLRLFRNLNFRLAVFFSQNFSKRDQNEAVWGDGFGY